MKTIEQWVPIYPGFYSVSNTGKVRSERTGRLLATGCSQRYPVVDLYINKVRHHWLLHRLVAVAFLGECPKGLEVNHRDGNRQNPRADNLEYVTPANNRRHAQNTGLIAKGAKLSKRLTEQDVLAIRRDAVPGKLAKLAAKYAVHLATIDYIVRRKTWRHL